MGLVKVVVSRAVRLRECPLGEFPQLYFVYVAFVSHLEVLIPPP